MLAACSLWNMSSTLSRRGFLVVKGIRCGISCKHYQNMKFSYASKPRVGAVGVLKKLQGTTVTARRRCRTAQESCGGSNPSHWHTRGTSGRGSPRNIAVGASGTAARPDVVDPSAPLSHNSWLACAGSGRVELITGPMFAGKTTELLKRVRVQEEAGRKVIVVKSSIDDRYSKSAIVSHNGEKQECYSLPRLSLLRDAAGSDVFCAAQVIAVDEAQFFGDLREFCDEAADVHGKVVIISGLSGDYRRQGFGDINSIVSIADHITQLTAICHFCEVPSPAPFTRRLVDDDRVELVGGADIYVPVCRRHYRGSLPQAR